MSNQGLLRLAEDLRASVERPSATTLSTITLQSGATRVVIALLQVSFLHGLVKQNMKKKQKSYLKGIF